MRSVVTSTVAEKIAERMKVSCLDRINTDGCDCAFTSLHFGPFEGGRRHLSKTCKILRQRFLLQ
ncbi:unnamed protein product [Chondrus crispus]|uniref:Uncharacterized protein n=1 Tax=Chondrus crispus TaxID=2769 RepID=R7QIQ3_CHOCR|nr:unnamed protein product [Chondrus crispus]CDF37356.1 unnamed protein product [Chondrus crispus]|eukprot:XP_005717175.1 unnamed protein product [Chondrus crispus]